MKSHTQTVLGISPGTRNMGIAIRRNGELIDARIKIFKGKWSDQKFEAVIHSINNIVEKCSPDTIALKVPILSSVELVHLVGAIEKIAWDKGINIKLYSLKQMKKQSNFRNKQGIAEFISGKFPELYSEYCKEKNLETGYYSRMFESVYITMTAEKDLQ